MTTRMKRGRGMAASWYGIARTATIDRAGAWAELDDGGTGKVVTGVTEIGEGILTVLAQVAADEMGITPEDVTIGDNDTARSPEAAHAGATRQTYMIGNSVALAGQVFFGLGGEIPSRNSFDWNTSETEEAAEQMLKACPKGAILITHTPPFGIAGLQGGGAHEGAMPLPMRRKA